MPDLSASLSNVRRFLAKPKANAPNDDTIIGLLISEQQHFANELGNSNTPYNLKEFSFTPSPTADVFITDSGIGKILFATANGGGYYEESIEFTDLQDASSNWWQYNPVIADRPEDYINGWRYLSSKLAFYRKNGALYAKTAPLYAAATIKVRMATGLIDPALDTVMELPQYHDLFHIRTALACLPEAEWSDDMNKDQIKRNALLQSLMMREQRIYPEFIQAKRSMTADDVTFFGDSW